MDVFEDDWYVVMANIARSPGSKDVAKNGMNLSSYQKGCLPQIPIMNTVQFHTCKYNFTLFQIVRLQNLQTSDVAFH